MRPPISSTKNDGVHSVAAPLHRKTQINQKEILAENQNVKNFLTKNNTCETIEIPTPIPVVINQDKTSVPKHLLPDSNIIKSQQDSISQIKQQQKLFGNFKENPTTSTTKSVSSSNDTIEPNLTKISSQLLNSNNSHTYSSNTFKQQILNQQQQQYFQQQQQQQSLNDSVNLRKLKRLSSDVSDNRLKNNYSNRFNDINNTFVSDNLIKTNSDLDSFQLFDHCYYNTNNSTTSELNLVNYIPNLNNDNNSINNIQLKNVPSNNIVNINSNKNKNNTSESIIVNFPQEDEYKQVEFYYKNEKNNTLLSTTSNNILLVNEPLDKEPLLKSIENITDIRETNRNIYFNKNSASLILNKNNKDLSINNDKFSDYKINNCSNFNNNSHNNIIKTTTATTTTTTTSATTLTTTKSNCIIECRANGANIRNNYNNINIYNNSCDTVTLNEENFEKSKKRKSFPINNYVQNFKPSINNSNIDLFDTDQLINQSTTATTNRKQLAYSWYAPVYSALQEEIDQESRDSSPIHNLANLKKKPFNSQIKSRHDENNIQSIIDDNETQSLLQNNNNQILIQPQTHQISSQKLKLYSNGTAENRIYDQTFPSKLNLNGSINNTQQNNIITTIQQNETNRPQNSTNYQQQVMVANQIPRKKRFENFIKTLVGRKQSKESPNNTMPSQNQNYYNYQHQQLQQQQSQLQQLQLQENTILDTHRTYSPPLPSPEITITHSSSQDFTTLPFIENGTINKNDISFETGSNHSTAGSAIHICDSTKIAQSSTLSLNTVQQKLWNFMPLLKREGSATSLCNEKSQSIVQYTGLRKCETVLALSSKSSTLYNQIPSSNYNYDYNSRASVPAVIYNRCVSYNPSGINNINNKYTTKRDSNSSCNGIEPIKPLNRLRNSSSITNANCSRCSSLLSVTASSSRYSLNNTNNSNNNNSNNNNNNSNYYINSSNNLINNNNNNNNNDNIIKNSCTTGSLYESLINSKKNLNSTSYGITRNESITSGGSSCVDSVDGGGITDVIISSPQSSKTDISTTATLNSTNVQQQRRKSFNIPFVCKLCLNDVNNSSDATVITQCNCSFCTECIKAYVEFEISEGAYEISCPDAQCTSQGIISLTEIASLASAHSLENHHRYRLNREIELDKTRTWCPRAGCETICLIGPQPSSSTLSSPLSSPNQISTINSATINTNTATIVTVASIASPSASSSSALIDDKVNSITTMVLCAVQCPTCHEEFCSGCKKAWHPNINCEENNRRLTEEGQDDSIGIPFDNDLIKSCPMCAVPIEKDEGCAQMMCKRCKHVFCWYCLASLDDDFLLRHYDKGPCKNKLGHSRASVVWHRAQVIGIFAGFGILLLVASPLLLLAAPCIICCKCRICSGGNTKLDDPDADFDEAIVLQR